MKDAKPPLLAVGFWWKAWGLLKSISNKAPFLILLENLFVNRTTKKLNKDITDKRLNEAELVGILILNSFVSSFYHKYSGNYNYKGD